MVCDKRARFGYKFAIRNAEVFTVPKHNRASHTRGFTFLELLIALAILAIVAALAAPDVGQMIKNGRIDAGVGDFTSALQMAKTEAASRVSPVTICKSADGFVCAGDGDWSQGWIVFVDEDGNGAVDNDDEVLLAHEALHVSMTFGTTNGVSDRITYRPSGTTTVPGTETLMLCDDRGMNERSRAILVTITGRGSVIKAKDTGRTACL